MYRNRLYYLIKPFIPWTVRMAVRRRLALRKRARVSDIWPIQPGSEKPPAGWPGWPEGRQFALVLTHDVEGPEGLARVRPLAELEMKLGFRSCFNFIPEGSYRVPDDLRTWLVSNGFEVGVHDLRHDGKLFATRDNYRRYVPVINRYLRDWGAAGFRAGFMLHNLDWLHDLDIQYDASTFDTDPFEPQPQGQHTIFPFWVQRNGPEGRRPKAEITHPHLASCTPDHAPRTPEPGANSPDSELRTPDFVSGRAGYVELPYTLPQDSTLFLLLGEKSPGIWIQKLDWIARHGGMALVNVHPDYLRFDDEPASVSTFPVCFYQELLEHAHRQYRLVMWCALPVQVASRTRNLFSKLALTGNASRPSVNIQSGTIPRALNKIWIDLDNTPHVPFFEPIIEELRASGFTLLVTARDAFQVYELAESRGLKCVRVGRHYGRHQLAKAYGLVYRALQMIPLVLRERPLLAVSHGARSQLIVCNLLRIPSILIEDYEHARFPWFTRPTWVFAPETIPSEALSRLSKKVLSYPGLKEDVYAWRLKPDPSQLRNLGIGNGGIVVTVRPPATEAHYHNPESEILFCRFMDRVTSTPGTRVILLPRNRKQADALRAQHPAWFKPERTTIPTRAVDGLNLIWFSDLVVSGGGTMNREAAALGVPVYSIFRGRIGAVDQQLVREGRLVLLESPEDVDRLIRLEKRTLRPVSAMQRPRTLRHIVDAIVRIAVRAAERPDSSA